MSKDEERMKNLIIYSTYLTDEELESARPFVAILLILAVLVCIFIF